MNNNIIFIFYYTFDNHVYIHSENIIYIFDNFLIKYIIYGAVLDNLNLLKFKYETQ